MTELAFISFALGAALAGRFPVVVLVVPTFIGLVGICGYMSVGNLSAADGLVAGLIFAFSLQSGFVARALLLDRLSYPARIAVIARKVKSLR